MDFFSSFGDNAKAEEWGESIEKAYGHYGVNIRIEHWCILEDRTIFQMKLKGNTREKQIYDYAHDVQFRLKFPLFLPIKVDFHLCIIVSDQKIEYIHLPEIISGGRLAEEMNKRVLPYVVGYDVVGSPVIVDLSKFIHLLIGGASNSGKTVGLRALIVSLAYTKSPNKVNIILIDVGATNLMPFAGIPHLSCPIVRDSYMGCKAVALLKAEMERRIELQESDVIQYNKLSRLVLMIDEFPALLAGVDDKSEFRMMINDISSLLQRGRHAKIYVILAAQNPTLQNMKIDLGNIIARIAFKCAKRNFSETILGVGGAENLLGNGDLYMKNPYCEDLQRIQGSFISEAELRQTVSNIKSKWMRVSITNKFTMNAENLRQEKLDCGGSNTRRMLMVKTDKSAKLLAEVTLWSLSHATISCNMISESFNVGWNRANNLIKQLHECGIVGDLDAKLPRKVLPNSVNEISEEVMKTLSDNGFSAEDVATAICNRN